ncbi:MAG: hypothetical protein ACOX0H_01155 [Patescibacteria group bacterium]|jgi:hypothetical protein
MNIVINTTGIDRFFSLPPDKMFFVFMGNFGWMIVAVIMLYGILQLYLFWLRGKWAETHKHVLLAIDVPKGNEQSPKAVENMFTYLGGAHGSVDFFEKWFKGEFQKSFSYEIVSLEGYTQFLVWTPVEFRNLIESSIYSQYPDAEISEVDDYTQTVPQRYPDEEYDIWGLEFTLSAPWMYPIKCYKDFEYTLGPSEMQFKDPMAALMDLCGSLRQDEQLWMQLIVTPIGFDWLKDAEKEINKILGRKSKTKSNLFMQGIESIGKTREIFLPWEGDGTSSEKKEEKQKGMMDLSPLEKRKIEGVNEKAGKLAFDVKIRVVYVARKDVMNKAKVGNGVIGYMKQFAALDLNNLRPEVKKTLTKTVYFWKKSRLIRKKNNLFRAYVNRSSSIGVSAKILNIEELATLWHFPVEGSVKASLIQRTQGKKADAPSSLPLANELRTPTESFLESDIFKNNLNIEGDRSLDSPEADEPPANLPFV